jgi:dTDP-4-dehydrorhamnose reductase
MVRILITGANGMLGSSLSKILSKHFNVFRTGRSEPAFNESNYLKFDLSSKNFNKLIEWSNPDIIIHCAAEINGNICQNNPINAFELNSFSLQKILESTSKEVKIIYISSDAVFSENSFNSKENDKTNSSSFYGKSKELGEFFLLSSKRNTCIIRTTIVGLSEKKQSFVDWIIDSSLRNNKIQLFSDVKFNPISVWDLSNEIMFIIKNNLNEKILHISGNEVSTKYEFGINLLKSLNLQTSNIDKGSISDFADRAKRSHDQTLSCEYYKKKYKRKLPSINETINILKYKYEN